MHFEKSRIRAAASAQGVVLLLASGDRALARSWRAVEPPQGLRLQSVPHLGPEHLCSGEAFLVVVDAAAVLAAEGALAEAFQTHAHRCVLAGPGRVLRRLGPQRLATAYDILVTPVPTVVLQHRVAEWHRSIQRTAALETLGQRVEELAQRSTQLAARLAEAEAEIQGLTRQRNRLEQALRRIRQVARLSREVNSLDLERIADVCVRQLPAVVEATRASLYLYDAAQDHLVLQACSGRQAVAKRVDLKENPRSPMAAAVKGGEVLLIGEFAEFHRSHDVPLDRDFSDHYATGSCIVVPLKGGGRVRGVLNLADKADGSHFDDEVDLPVVEQIAELIGAGLYNVELYQEMERLAKTDPLTGLVNRRALEEALARETDRSRRYGSPLTVMMFDVDHLKEINDRAGHAAGDAVLRNLASVLLETVRSVDVPGRWAGDEFVVVLPDTSAAQAEQVGRRLLRLATQQPADARSERPAANLSVGVAQYRKDESPESLIHRADLAMYAAKRAGGGRIASLGTTDAESRLL